jgi:hypothetical protein
VQLFAMVSGERVNLDHVVTIVTNQERIELRTINGLTKVISDPAGVAKLESIFAGKVV